MDEKKKSRGVIIKLIVMFLFISIMFLEIGAYVLYGDEKNLSFSYNEGGVVALNGFCNNLTVHYEDAFVGGKVAYCLDYGSGIPTGGTVTYLGDLSSQVTSSLVYGYKDTTDSPSALGLQTKDEARLATQFAVWYFAKENGQATKLTEKYGEFARNFSTDAFTATAGNEAAMGRIINATNRIISRVNQDPYVADPKFSVDTSSAVVRMVSDKVIAGPYIIESSGYEQTGASVSITSGHQSAYISDENGSRTNTSGYRNGTKFYVAVSKDAQKSQIGFKATATGSYRVGRMYGTGNPYDQKQNFAIITYEPYSAEVNCVWSVPNLTGKLEVYKVDEEGNIPLQGVEFALKDSTGKIICTKLTDVHGKIDFGDLSIGKYSVEETKPLQGYLAANVPTDVNVEYGKTHTLTFKNRKVTGGLKILKVGEDEEPIPNVTFKIYDSNGNEVDTIVTNADGEAVTKKLPVGKYYYQEQSGYSEPDYIIIDLNKKEFEIKNNNETVERKEKNDYVRGSIVIVKTDENEGRLQGALYDIFDANKNYIETVETDENGIATTSKLKKGKYYYQEKQAPNGYRRDENFYDISLTYYNVEQTRTNTPWKGKLKVIKKGDDGKPIKDVEFKIYKANSIEEINPLTMQPVDILVTNEQGEDESIELEKGKYYYVETKAPDNVVRDTNYHEFYITKDNEVIEKEIENELLKYGKLQLIKKDDEKNPVKGIKFEILDSDGKMVDEMVTGEDGKASSKELLLGTYFYKEVENDASKPYVVDTKMYEFELTEKGQVLTYEKVNVRKRGSIDIFKVDEDGNFLKDISFTLMDANGNEIASKKTDETGHAIFDNLLPGKYSFKEVDIPAIYVNNEETQTVEITLDKLNVESKVENEFAKGKIRIIKSDELGKKLSGVKFNILDSDGKIVDVLTTDENGSALSKKLRLGTYYYQEDETSIPEGVIADTKKYEFKLTENDFVLTKKITNENKKGSLSIFKVDKDGNYLENVTFTLIDSKGKEVDKKTTGKDGLAKFENLLPGKYKFKEVDAPVFLVKNEEPQVIEITVDKLNVEVKVENEYASGKIQIHKTDYADNNLEGVVFEILDENKKVIETLTTDKDGLAITGKLKVGKYYYLEKSAKDENIIIDTKPHEVKITENGKTIKEEVKNKTFSGTVIIKKVDLDNHKKLLKGAEIEILDENKNVIKKLVTDENGQVKLGDLKVGKYYYRETKAPEGYVLDSKVYEFKISKEAEVENIVFKNELKKLPQTGGFFSTNLIIVLIVSAVSITGYVIICIRRAKKNKYYNINNNR